jgi:RNA recognition motif-containing protein
LIDVDRATKNLNGSAFALFKDESSADKAIAHYNKGLAAIYGTPFIISSLQIPLVDDDAGNHATSTAYSLWSMQLHMSLVDIAFLF